MSQSKELLKACYLDPIKEDSSLFVGIELEFPLVNLEGNAVDKSVALGLLVNLQENLGFVADKFDTQGKTIQISDTVSGDIIMFEITYNTLEIAFSKSKTIGEAAKRFDIYLSSIQSYLSKYNYALLDNGINPNWRYNINRPLDVPRYQMLMAYLTLSKKLPQEVCHNFPDYGAFICGNQVQLDVNKKNYITVLNVFNQVEAAKAYLFANSEFDGENWDTRISRDIFWEDSLHGLFEKNAGLYDHNFTDEEDVLDYLDETVLFTAERDGSLFYFLPIQAKEYLQKDSITAYDLTGAKVELKPSVQDFNNHRAYLYQSLTRRGTVEFRSVCTQSFKSTFAPIAFHLGLLANLESAENYLSTASFFEENGRNYRYLRRQFSKKILSEEEISSVSRFTKELCKIAYDGLCKRGYGEEVYLEHLIKN